MAQETLKEPKILQSYNEKSELTIDLRATQIQESAPLKVSQRTSTAHHQTEHFYVFEAPYVD